MVSCSVCEVNRDRKDRGELYNVLARLGRKAKGLQNLRFAGVVAPSSLSGQSSQPGLISLGFLLFLFVPST